MNETQLGIIGSYFRRANSSETSKNFAELLILEIKHLQQERDHWKNEYNKLWERVDQSVKQDPTGFKR